MYLPGSYDAQKKALDSLKFELQKIVSHHVGLGIKPGSYSIAASSFQPHTQHTLIRILLFILEACLYLDYSLSECASS